MSEASVQIVLPWPHKALWPNSRAHWAAKAREVKKHRQWATWATPARLQVEADKLSVTVTFNPPDIRARDTDNAVAAVKSYLDGIADSLGVNDSIFEIEKPVRGPVVKAGRVVFEVKAA